MKNKMRSLTLLVNLGIYGVALPAFAAETTTNETASNDDTIVVTAAQQNLQAPGYQPSPLMRSAKTHPHVTFPKSSAPCPALT
jgi:hypothetical protein